MQRSLVALVLTATFTVPAFAAGATVGADPSCSDFMAMTESDRTKAVEQMAGAMPDGSMSQDTATDTPSMAEMGSGGTAGGTMASDNMASNAMKACESSPDSTLSEAVKMLGDG